MDPHFGQRDGEDSPISFCVLLPAGRPGFFGAVFFCTGLFDFFGGARRVEPGFLVCRFFPTFRLFDFLAILIPFGGGYAARDSAYPFFRFFLVARLGRCSASFTPSRDAITAQCTMQSKRWLSGLLLG